MARRAIVPPERVRRVLVRPSDWAQHDMGRGFDGEPALCSTCDLSWYPGITVVGRCDPDRPRRKLPPVPERGMLSPPEDGQTEETDERKQDMSADGTETGTATETPEQAEMAERLVAAGKTAEKQARARRERDVRGSHLLPGMLDAVRARGLKSDETSGFYKVSGPAGKGKRVYVAKKGGRVDLSGFSVEHAAIELLTPEQAKEKHLGKVSGQFDFSKDDAAVMEAFSLALDVLAEGPAAPVASDASPDASTETTGA
jgi:hypothetical protein